MEDGDFPSQQLPQQPLQPTTDESVEALRSVVFDRAMEEAVQATQSIDERPSFRDKDENKKAFLTKAKTLAKVSEVAPGLVDEALEMIDRAENKYDKAGVAKALTPMIVATDNIDKALGFFDASEDEGVSRNGLLGGVAAELAHNDRPDEAIARAGQITSLYERGQVLTKILEDFPEKAPEIHAAMMDTSNDREITQEYQIRENGKARIKVLTKLAERIPEASKEAVDIVNTIDSWGSFDVEMLLELSKFEPTMFAKAVEMGTDYARRRGSYFTSKADMEVVEQQAKRVEQAALTLIKQGHVEEASKIVDVWGATSSRIEHLAPHLVSAAIEAGQAEQFATRNKMGEGLRSLAGTLDLLPHVYSPETRARVIEDIRNSGRMLIMAKAAEYAPELISEVDERISNAPDTMGNRDIHFALAPAYFASGQRDKAIEALRASHYADKFVAGLKIPDDLQLYKDVTYSLLNGGAKAAALAEIAQYHPEGVAEAVRIIEEDTAPWLKEQHSKENRWMFKPYMENDTIKTAKALGEAGFLDEAMRVSGALVTRDGYRSAVAGFIHERPGELSDFLHTFDGRYTLETSKREDADEIVNQLTTVLKNLPEEHLGLALEHVATYEIDALKLAAIDAVWPTLVASGRQDQILKVLPEKIPYIHNLKFLDQIGSELIGQGDIATVRLLAERMDREHGYKKFLGKLSKESPEIAQDLWNTLRQEVEEDKIDYGHREYVLATAAFVPEAADYIMSLLREDAKGYAFRWSKYKLQSFEKEILLMAKLGRGTEALEIADKVGVRHLREKLAPQLSEQWNIYLALEGARRTQDPVVRAKALASLIPRDREPAHKTALHELLGEAGVEGGLHAVSDRSLNVTFFVGEIAKDPLLIEVFLSRASSPAEIKAIMKTVDSAADMVENGTELRIQALRLLERYGTSEVMSKYWKQDLQKQALDSEKAYKADHEGFKNLPNVQQLTANINTTTLAKTKELLVSGYTVTDLFEYPWLINGDILSRAKAGEMFPATGSKVEQHEWLADNAFVEMEGFSRRQVGQIIANRLSGNMEYNLHDASLWLEAFKVKDEIEWFNAEVGQLELKQLRNTDTERALLYMLVKGNYPPEELRRLPGFASAGGEIQELKTQKFDQLFSYSAYTIVYAAILQELASSDTNKIESSESLINRINEWAESGLIERWLGQGKEVVESRVNMTAEAVGMVDLLLAEDYPLLSGQEVVELKIPNVVGKLGALGRARKEYTDATTTWLKTYQNLPAQKLTRVWDERQKSLQAGIPDHPNDIYQWSLSSGLREHISREVDENGMLDGDIPAVEMMAKFRPFLPELATRYGSGQTTGALIRLWREHNPEADLPPLSVNLPDGYTFKVFSKDDPAGMTIGYDTDCCMTLGGASESCIYAGYSDPRFGFVGLYDQNDKLVAQSFIWHNEGTLVMDNIEGQRGRNLGDIQAHYRTALTEYMAQLYKQKPELDIRAVNIGTGYMNAQLMQGLQSTAAVPLPSGKSVYTDSRNQVQLLNIPEEELRRLSSGNVPENPDTSPALIEPQPERLPVAEILTITSPDEGSRIISGIEAQVYPNELVLGREDIQEDLKRPNNYSFMIGSRNGNGGTVGYLIAYRDQDLDGVYVSDLALLPDERRAGYGAAALNHLLSKTAEAGEHRIVFEARETTSFQALQSPTAAAILAKYGYKITNSRRKDNYFNNGEAAYEVSIEMDRVLAGVS